IGESLLASNSAGTRNGPIAVDGLFSGVELQVYQDGTATSLYPNVILEDQPSVKCAGGVETWRTTAPKTTQISVDITLPRGLYSYNDSGAKQNHSVTVEVRRRAVGSGTAWDSCPIIGVFSLTRALAKTLRYSVAQNVTEGQYEVGVRRITADDPPDFKGSSLVQWTALRSIRADAPVAAAVRGRYVLLALKIKASDQLQGVVDQLNLVAEAEVAAYSGSGSGSAAWTLGFSRNPAAAFLRQLRGPSNPRPVPDSAIDWPRLESWFTTCQAKGWTCDAVLSSGERLRDTLQKIAQAGRASLTIRDGLYSVVVDDAKTAVVQHFTPRNVRNFAWTKAFKDLPHGLKMNFVSEGDGWASNERIVYMDGYTEANATKFQQIDLWGITSSDLAWTHGRYKLAVAKLRPEAFVFETDAEGIVCEPGDLILVSHDAILVGLAAGRVKSVVLDGSNRCTAVTVDEFVTMETGKTYGARFRRSDGLSVYAAASLAVGEGATLSFPTPIPAGSTPAPGDLFTFGEAGIETMRCIVAGIEALEDLGCRITAVDEAPGVHTADSGTIPEFSSKISRPAGLSLPAVVEGLAPPVTPQDPTVGGLLDYVSNYANNVPPSNNVTGLAIVATNNADGSVNIALSWDYAQGAVKADGFLVYYKSETQAPGAIVMASDPAAFVAASETATAYAHTLAGLPARFGGAGAMERHYRFAVVAVGTRRGGTIPHNAGVVELAGWIDKTFAPAITLSEGLSSINLEPGGLVWRDSGGVELARLMYDQATGILQASKLGSMVKYRGSWFLGSFGAYTEERTDFSPGKKLCARPLSGDRAEVFCPHSYGHIYRLERAADGTWSASAAMSTDRTAGELAIAETADGKLLFVGPPLSGSGNFSEWFRNNDGTLSAVVSIPISGGQQPSLAKLPDGRHLLVYATSYVATPPYYDIRYAIRGLDGTWSASTLLFTGGVYPDLAMLPDGRVLAFFTDNNAASGYPLKMVIRATNGTWGTPSNVSSGAGYEAASLALPDGRVMVVFYVSSDKTVRRKIRATDGTWGAETTLHTGSTTVEIRYQALALLTSGKVLQPLRLSTLARFGEMVDSSYFTTVPIADRFASLEDWEVGENSNGNYLKFPDGTLICWGKATIASNNNGGTAFTFPFVFKTPPTLFAMAQIIHSSGLGSSTVTEIGAVTTSGAYMKALGHAATVIYDITNVVVHWQARGFWK
ncbi:MAG: hypothetical protein JNG85_08370, partial [Spirochaetaceae bacterium]|nr:hypothetical protein [Spirochaetaceae bacterium]